MRRTSKRKTYKKRSYKPRPKMAKKKYTVRSLVRREIKRMAEDKLIQTDLGPYNMYQYIDAATTYNLLPTISQGTGQANRIGNKIRVTKAVLRMALTIFNQSVTYGPTYVDVYIHKYRNWSALQGTLPPSSMNDFLQVGNSSTSYSGVMTDWLRPVNSDQFQLVFKKRIYLYNPLNSTSVSGSTSSINPSRTLVIPLTKHLKKLVMYDDTQNLPTNDQLWLSVGCTQMDGNSLPAATVMGKYQAIVDFRYEDM